ncbi:MAG: hypothetical protein PUF79_04225 [Lactobacillaceae bacterium]|nr:hypothetical protein [Lactobacillaceae bacterium]
MSKVYTLLIENYDALDGYMTKNDVKVFTSKEACEKWIAEETKRQAEQGFKLSQSEADPECWEFYKNSDHGALSHEFYGQYRDVIGGGK